MIEAVGASRPSSLRVKHDPAPLAAKHEPAKGPRSGTCKVLHRQTRVTRVTKEVPEQVGSPNSDRSYDNSCVSQPRLWQPGSPTAIGSCRPLDQAGRSYPPYA